MKTGAATSDRTTEIKRIWVASKELGMDGEMLRDVVAQVTGVRDPATGEGSISRLGARQRRIVLSHLQDIKRGAKKAQEHPRGGWLATEAQVRLIGSLHRELADMGVLREPVGFMQSQTGRTDAANLPRVGRQKASAQGYIELLMGKKTRALTGGVGK